MSSNNMPLEGLTIIDASTMIAAPWSATYLADYGANVIKIEHPIKGDHARDFGSKKNDIPLFWKTLNRNKKTITLNLSSNEGQEIFKELVKKADVVIENFRPGVFAKWNLDYKSLSKINPSLIMLSTTGYGQEGPYSNRAGFGTVAEAMSGFASVTGEENGQPLLPGIPLADGVASVFGALAIMIAIYERNSDPKKVGQSIDMSIYEPLMRFMEVHIMNYNHLNVLSKRKGNRSSTSAPRNAYMTKDGNWIALSGSAQIVAERIFQAIGREDLILNEKFKNNHNRLKNVEELDSIISQWIISKNMDEALEILNSQGAVVGPMYNVQQMMEDVHFKARESFISLEDEELGSVTLPNVFAKFSKTPGEVRHTGRKKGEYNKEIYMDLLDMSEEQLNKLIDKNII